MSTIQVNPPNTSTYPASLNVDYPDRPLDRLTSFFRLITVIPIAIIIGLLTNASMLRNEHAKAGWDFAGGGGGVLFLALALMILFRQKYPRWWFDWDLALIRFGYRVSSYILLLRDEYPSTDEEQAVHVEMTYPDAKLLSRGMPLVKWFLAIPHYVVLFFLFTVGIVCWVIAWFAILFTGRYPKGLFDFIVGIMRWQLRVIAYAFMLITDKYPSFSLEV
jgi:hypothetical protein